MHYYFTARVSGSPRWAAPQKAVLLLLLSFILAHSKASAQDPKLPPGNFGLSNMQDGHPPGVGWYFQQFVQVYQSEKTYDDNGNKLAASGKFSTMLAMSQLIFLSNIKVATGNLGWTVLVPLVKIAATTPAAQPLSANPSPLGDVIAGTTIQWFDRHFLGTTLNHRLEVDVSVPIGGFQRAYVINPSTHFFYDYPLLRLHTFAFG